MKPIEIIFNLISEERKLASSERPLWVQLEWGKDGREGRFLLKNENATTVKVRKLFQLYLGVSPLNILNFIKFYAYHRA